MWGDNYFPRLLASARLQARCFYALIIREIMLRYGRDNLGFLWVFIEPMLLCVGVMLLWSFIKVPFQHGIPLVSFVLTGYMPLTLWRHLTGGAIHLFRRNANLLYHRNVTLLDLFLARMVLEFVGATTALVLVSAVLTSIGLMPPPEDVGITIVGWVAMAFLSLGAAVVISVMTERWEVSEKFIQPFQYLFLPLCGFLYMLDWLPSAAQNVAWYVPTVHCFEMVREGYLGNSVRAEYSIWYPFVWAVGLIAIGFGFIEKVRDYVHS